MTDFGQLMSQIALQEEARRAKTLRAYIKLLWLGMCRRVHLRLHVFPVTKSDC